MAQKDVKSRIGSVKNIQKITRAMEMVAAARLRRAEQRIEALRPYASAIRRMTRQAAEAAQNVPNMPILAEHDSVNTVGLLLVTGDRGLAGAFNSQIVRAGVRIAAELMTAYVDGKVDQVEIVYNHYISPLAQRVTRETLLPLQQATIMEGDEGLGGRAAGSE